MSTHVESGQRLTFEHGAVDTPFGRELSLAPLIAYWRQAPPGGMAARIARLVEEELGRAPELLEPIRDLSVLARHRELVDVLMSKIFPRGLWETDLTAAIFPLQYRVFYATPAVERLFLDSDGLLRGRINLEAAALRQSRLLNAYDLILRKYYGVGSGVHFPTIATTTDPESGLERHFRLQLDRRFLEVEAIGPVPELGDAERRRLLANLSDTQTLLELLPPDRFVFRGFGILRATDVTDQEVLSALKRDLIDKESIVANARFQDLQAKLRTLFRKPDLRLGLAAIQGDEVFMLNYGSRMENACIFADSVHHKTRDFVGTIYARAVGQGTPLFIDDLAEMPNPTCIEETLLETGVRSVVVAPLHYQDTVIGTLELDSPTPGDFGALNQLRLQEVLPLFSMAVRRSLEELESRVQAVIKEKCTAIHPSIEWRFRQAVLRGIERRTGAPGGEMEPIVFRDVYPLYGIADIRGSSVQRNLAIQTDVLAQLGLARDVVRAAREARPLPILDELGYRIKRRTRQIERVLNSGDEVTTGAFLREHVEPLLDHLGAFGPSVRARVEAYRSALDPAAGAVYRQRREFEDSVNLLADAVSTYLDAEQEMAQTMFPHYFEKQRTDGVDYSIYVGAALVENGEFDPLYLRNLRLWQLMVACGIARRAEAVRERLTVPLETTHLVLAHHAPLSIHFRFDEKRFDVDGAYDVRYEVTKKRIDKAVIRGTGERVTQPGRLVIVYSQPVEAAEYRGYLEYLSAAGYLTGPVEDHQLEELQGVQGLRALRATIDLAAPVPDRPGAAAAAAAGVRGLSR